MNTYSFINRINSDNLSNIVIKFFDEIMILYNLLGDRQDISIYKQDDNAAEFKLLMQSNEDAIELYEVLNNSYFSVYENMYTITMEISDNVLSTTISRAISY